MSSQDATATSPVSILGLTLQVPQVYSAGHVCSASEAAALNRVLTKGIAKGLHKVLAGALASTGYSRVDKIESVTTRQDIEARAREYIASFLLGFAEGHEKQRAVRVECERIARDALEARLYAQGRTLKDLPEGEREAIIEQIASSDKVRAEAERRVGLQQHVAQDAHEELLASVAANGGSDA